MSRHHRERNVDDDEGEDSCPDGNVINQFLTEVVEDSGEVDRVDRSNKAGSKPSKQVAAKSHTFWSCRFHLVERYTSTTHVSKPHDASDSTLKRHCRFSHIYNVINIIKT